MSLWVANIILWFIVFMNLFFTYQSWKNKKRSELTLKEYEDLKGSKMSDKTFSPNICFKTLDNTGIEWELTPSFRWVNYPDLPHPKLEQLVVRRNDKFEVISSGWAGIPITDVKTLEAQTKEKNQEILAN